MAAKKKAVSKSAAPKKKATQPGRPDSLKNGGRYSEGYGPFRETGNPGAGMSVRPRVSDYIRPPMMNKKKGKK